MLVELLGVSLRTELDELGLGSAVERRLVGLIVFTQILLKKNGFCLPAFRGVRKEVDPLNSLVSRGEVMVEQSESFGSRAKVLVDQSFCTLVRDWQDLLGVVANVLQNLSFPAVTNVGVTGAVKESFVLRNQPLGWERRELLRVVEKIKLPSLTVGRTN